MKDVPLADLSAIPDHASSGEVALERPSSSSRARGGHVAGEIFAGKYEIVGLLGEGGMGTVWRARNLLLGVDVAIKVLHRTRADQEDQHASARLLREARATAGIAHAGIVRIFDFGETEAGESFLVMELLEGTSLADWIDRHQRMSATDAVRTLLPIAGALCAAHAHGVVHRDVKPENILLATDSAGSFLPKILDFGIAKLLTTQTGRVLTQAGAVIGSLEYMSPEQAEGKAEVGEQTDVWALSVVLYELLTGQRPFAGGTLTATLFALLASDPTPTTDLGAGDVELWDILARGLAKSPAGRWPTMRAFGSALAFWAVERGIETDAAGTALKHDWLADPSQRTATPAGGTPISALGAAASSVALPPPPPKAPAETPARPRRIDTFETTYIAGVPPPPRRRMALLAAAAVLVPALVLTGLYARRGADAQRASALAQLVLDDAGAVDSPAAALPPAPSREEARAPLAAASGVPAVPESEASTRLPEVPRRRPLPARPKRPSDPPMPLPAAPNF